jgi:hypothetical protein
MSVKTRESAQSVKLAKQIHRKCRQANLVYRHVCQHLR